MVLAQQIYLILTYVHQLMHHEKGQPIVNEILKPLLDKFPNQEDLDKFIEEIINNSK